MATFEDWREDVLLAYRGALPSRAQILMAIKEGARGIMARDVESDLALAKSYHDRFERAKFRLAGTRIEENLGVTIAAVRALMPTDADTEAVDAALDNAIEAIRGEFNSMADRFDSLLVEAAIELQRHVPFYRVRQLVSYLMGADGVTNESFVSRVTLPEDARVKQVWFGAYYPALAEGEELEEDDIVVSNGRLYRTITGGTLGDGELGVGLLLTDGEEEDLGDLSFVYYGNVRDFPARKIPWEQRQMLISGDRISGPAYAMPDEQDELWFYPRLDDTHRFDVEYVGIAQSFEDDDVVHFDRVAAKAASHYIRGMLEKTDREDPRAAEGSLAIYQRAIREAVLDCQDREVGPDISNVPYDWSRRRVVYGSLTTGTSDYPNGYMQRVNSAGDISLESSAANMTIDLLVTGVARTSIVVLETAGRAAGDRLLVRMELPAVADIVFDFRNATAGGTALLPDELFSSQLFTTDGEATSANFEFVFNGTAWEYDTSQTPA
jgi:hypothetical protein